MPRSLNPIPTLHPLHYMLYPQSFLRTHESAAGLLKGLPRVHGDLWEDSRVVEGTAVFLGVNRRPDVPAGAGRMGEGLGGREREGLEGWERAGGGEVGDGGAGGMGEGLGGWEQSANLE